MVDTRLDSAFTVPVGHGSKKQSLGEYRNKIAELVRKKRSNFMRVGIRGNHTVTEWETGYMLRDLDSGQVIVS
jgi:hypothetical protein